MHVSRFLLLLGMCAILAVASGCSSPFPLTHPSAAYSADDARLSGITVTARDRTTLRYHDDSWHLTLEGIAGTASIVQQDGTTIEKDTTLSYAEISAAESSSGRGSTMTQFLLTILGVVLVIGLAAIILYAAFRATDR